MPRPRNAIPSYRRHKQSGQAVVTIRDAAGGRRDVLLGKYKSPESKIEYERILAELRGGRSPLSVGEDGLFTVNVLCVKFLDHAANYYRNADGTEAEAVRHYRKTIKKVRELYGHTAATLFGPKALMTVMDGWVNDGISRKEINGRCGRVKRVFKWAVREELLPPECFQKLATVEGLAKGRTAAPEGKKVTPARQEDVEKVLAVLPPSVAVIVQVMIHSGARCGELVGLRVSDIDRTGTEWTYSPTTHKGTWRGKTRTIYFGKRCQELLAPLLLKAGGPDEYVFSPVREERERNTQRSENRVTPRYPSHMRHNAKRKAKNRRRAPGDRYRTPAVRRAIERACDKVGVPHFTPHRLRHLAATLVRSKFGVDVARAMLGHTLAAVTEIYSHEVDKELALKAVRAMG